MSRSWVATLRSNSPVTLPSWITITRSHMPMISISSEETKMIPTPVWASRSIRW